MKIARCCCNFSFSALLLFFGVASACACEIKEDKCCPSTNSKNTPCHSSNETTEHKNCLHCDNLAPKFSALAEKISLEIDIAFGPINNLVLTTRKLPKIDNDHFLSSISTVRNSSARAPPALLS